MPEKPPKKQKEEKESLKKEPDPSWENDIEERSYYYDDATGYEDYDPEKDDEEDETEL